MAQTADKTFGNVFLPYGATVPNVTAIKYHDAKHTPDNKRAGQVDSQLTILAKRSTGNDTLELSFAEITTTTNFETGQERTASRTISTDMPLIEAVKLARFILEAAATRASIMRNVGPNVKPLV